MTDYSRLSMPTGEACSIAANLKATVVIQHDMRESATCRRSRRPSSSTKAV
jgi:hypothetical protein